MTYGAAPTKRSVSALITCGSAISGSVQNEDGTYAQLSSCSLGSHGIGESLQGSPSRTRRSHHRKACRHLAQPWRGRDFRRWCGTGFRVKGWKVGEDGEGEHAVGLYLENKEGRNVVKCDAPNKLSYVIYSI